MLSLDIKYHSQPSAMVTEVMAKRAATMADTAASACCPTVQPHQFDVLHGYVPGYCTYPGTYPGTYPYPHLGTDLDTLPKA